MAVGRTAGPAGGCTRTMLPTISFLMVSLPVCLKARSACRSALLLPSHRQIAMDGSGGQRLSEGLDHLMTIHRGAETLVTQ